MRRYVKRHRERDSMTRTDVLVIAGARPNIPKVWTFLRGIEKLTGDRGERKLAVRVVHSGQHYHELLGESFARRLGISVSENLNVGSCESDSSQMAALVDKIGSLIMRLNPAMVVVVGDVNTSVAGALVASRSGIPVIHVEAGLRSGAWDPEEVNRKIITASADYHLAPSETAVCNLLSEGIPQNDVFLVGNTMAECHLAHRKERAANPVLQDLGLTEHGYCLFTVHKPINLSRMSDVIRILLAVAEKERVVFPCHPHTKMALQHQWRGSVRTAHEILFAEPFDYFAFGRLLMGSRFVVTDSAGVQEEATVEQVRCLTIGPGTARPETVLQGSNTIIGYDLDFTNCDWTRSFSCPPYWDERVSERIAAALRRILNSTTKRRWITRIANSPGGSDDGRP